MRKLALISIGALLITTQLTFACNLSMCPGYQLPTKLVSHFNLSQGKMIEVKTSKGLAYGGSVNVAQNSASLCCMDADQFFAVEATDKDGKSHTCVFDNGIEGESSDVYSHVVNGIPTGQVNDLICSATQVATNDNQYVFNISASFKPHN